MVAFYGRTAEPKKPDGSPTLPVDTAAGQNAVAVTNAAILAAIAPRATDPIKNGTSSVVPDPTKVSSSSVKSLPSLVANPMEQFSSINVLWTLAPLTPEQYNNPPSYRNSTADLKFVVFSSGGRFDEQRISTKFGTPEYFVNNFVMTNVIGANEKTGNSNAVKFSFDIVEPHSMGLLLQSMQAAAISAGYLNYLQNCPYVLRMDMQGFDELGRVITSIKPKFFVMKLVKMAFTVNESGSTYKVEAVPYNHMAFSDSVNVTYSDLKISGEPSRSGIVADLLQNSSSGLTAVLNRNEQKLVEEKRITYPDIYSIEFPISSSDWYSNAGKKEKKTNSATINLDDQNDKLAITKTPSSSYTGGVSSQPSPALPPVNPIGLSSLGFDQISGGTNTFKRAGDSYDEKTGLVNRDGITIDPKQRSFQFGQGQSLTAIINQVVLSSEYAFNAIQKKNTKEGYIAWFKLDAQVEILTPVDDLIGDYPKKVTYRVVPYYVHQSIFSNVTSAPVGYYELMKTVCKEYQYIYTGQNVDVLKFDIEINNLAYSGIKDSGENTGSKTDNQDQKNAEKLNLKTEAGKGNAPASAGAQQGRPRPQRDPRLLQGYKGGSSEKTTQQNVAETFQQALLSGNSADMVIINLEIMGDPYWIIDSGMSNYFAGAPSDTSQITNDGTANYESGNVYVYLTFRTPVDITEQTGLYNFGDTTESPFGGIYRVVLCENTFSDGQWKQKLKCIRMPGPQGPEVTAEDKTGKITQTDTSAIKITEKEAPKTSPTKDTAPATGPAKGQSADSLRNKSRREQKNAQQQKTTTTSTNPPVNVGFKYYRDLGQK